MPKNKYNARRITVDGITYDSKREAHICEELKILERAGDIEGLVIHPCYEITVNDEFICGFTADAAFYDKRGLEPRHRVIDVKSDATAKRRDFKLICKLMKAVNGIEIEVVK